MVDQASSPGKKASPQRASNNKQAGQGKQAARRLMPPLDPAAAPRGQHLALSLFTLDVPAIDAASIEIVDAASGAVLAAANAAAEEAAIDAEGSTAAQQPDGGAAEASDSGDDEGAKPAAPAAVPSAAGYACRICGAAFAGVVEQREHFKGSWHAENLRRSMRGEPIVGEDEARTAEPSVPEPASDDSAASSDGSDDEGDDDFAPTAASRAANHGDDDLGSGPAAPSRTLVAFRLLTHPDTLLTAYRAALPFLPAWPAPVTPTALHTALAAAQRRLRCVYLMLGGGHFAGAVIDGAGTVVAKASVHRYTTRRKQGGSQSAHDGAGGKAKSAGAQLRRYNEAQLARDVWATLEAWEPHLASADVIFVVAPGAGNRRTLLNHPEGRGVQRDDARIHGVPFATRRAGYTEVLRIHKLVTALGVGAYVTPAAEPERDVPPQDVPAQPDAAPLDAGEPAAEDAEFAVKLKPKKRKPRTGTRKTGTLPQAAGAATSESGSSESDDDDESWYNPKAAIRTQATLAARSARSSATGAAPGGAGHRLGSASSATPSPLMAALSLGGMPADQRAALERERRARAAERRLGIPPAAAVASAVGADAGEPVAPSQVVGRTLSAASTPSMRAPSAAAATAPPTPAVEDEAEASGPRCDQCRGPITKPMKRQGKIYCGVKCAAAASKRG